MTLSTEIAEIVGTEIPALQKAWSDKLTAAVDAANTTLAAEVAHANRLTDLPHMHHLQWCVQLAGDIKRFRECSGRMLGLIDSDDHGKRLAGPLGDRLAPDDERALRPVRDFHGVPAQRPMVSRAGTHDQKAGGIGCTRQHRRDRTLDGLGADRQIWVRRSHGGLRRGQDPVAVTGPVRVGWCVSADEMPVQTWDRV